MARKPLIGITTYAPDEDGWVGLPANYVDSIRRAGGIPVLLPPGEPHIEDWFQSIDALILAGGGDIDPKLYESERHELNYKVSAERDRDELILARRVVEERLPTLAICRGMQVFNIAFGGTLIPHLPDVVGEKVLHRRTNHGAGHDGDKSTDHGPIPHPVTVDRNALVARVMGHSEIEAASWHHQAVDRVADAFRVVGHAPDGTIEAMEMPGHPWLLMVQWHPEITAAEDQAQQRLFDGIVRAASGEDAV